MNELGGDCSKREVAADQAVVVERFVRGSGGVESRLTVERDPSGERGYREYG